MAQTPTLKAHVNDRESIIYVFGCLEEGCGGSKGSWRAFRWTDQGVDEPAEDTDRPAQTSAHPKSQKSAISSGSTDCTTAASSWGLDDASLDNAFDLGDLSAQLNDLMANTKNPKGSQNKSGRSKSSKTQSTPATKPQNTSIEAFDGRIPAFYLVHAADIPPTMDMDSEDEEEARYGSRYQSQDTTGASINQAKGADADDGTDADEWGGEAYERDAVIRTGKQHNTSSSLENETAFIAYMKELSRVPDQCLRVYGGGTGVPYAWPTSHPDISSACPRCGEKRRCAVQIMSPLIIAMTEGLDMALDASKEVPKGRAKQTTQGTTAPTGQALCGPPSTWDWATLAVSICSKSCLGDGGLIEEDVRVLGEA